jgi:hypothetical protein
MALADKTPATKRADIRCSVALTLSRMNPQDRETLIGWLDDPRYTSAAIWRILTEEGHQVGMQTVGRHRKGMCSCGTR